MAHLLIGPEDPQPDLLLAERRAPRRDEMHAVVHVPADGGDDGERRSQVAGAVLEPRPAAEDPEVLGEAGGGDDGTSSDQYEHQVGDAGEHAVGKNPLPCVAAGCIGDRRGRRHCLAHACSCLPRIESVRALWAQITTGPGGGRMARPPPKVDRLCPTSVVERCTQRYGGTYIRPPLVHKSLGVPSSERPIGVMLAS